MGATVCVNIVLYCSLHHELVEFFLLVFLVLSLTLRTRNQTSVETVLLLLLSHLLLSKKALLLQHNLLYILSMAVRKNYSTFLLLRTAGLLTVFLVVNLWPLCRGMLCKFLSSRCLPLLCHEYVF